MVTQLATTSPTKFCLFLAFACSSVSPGLCIVVEGLLLLFSVQLLSTCGICHQECPTPCSPYFVMVTEECSTCHVLPYQLTKILFSACDASCIRTFLLHVYDVMLSPF